MASRRNLDVTEPDERTGRLDYPPNCNQLEVERVQLLPSYDGALFWKVWFNSDFGIFYSL